MKGLAPPKSVAFANTTYHSGRGEDTFIPAQSDPNEHLYLWKDFREDVRKRLENSTSLIINRQSSKSRGRALSKDKHEETFLSNTH
jgi:hypothetical protein